MLYTSHITAMEFKINPGIQTGFAVEFPKHEIDAPGEFNEQVSTQTRADPFVIATLEYSFIKNISILIGYGFNEQTFRTRHSLDTPMGSIFCPEGKVEDEFVSESVFKQNHTSFPLKIRYRLNDHFSVSAGVDYYKYSEVSIVSDRVIKQFYGPDQPCEYYVEEYQNSEDVSDQYKDWLIRSRLGMAYHFKKFNLSIDVVSRVDDVPESQFNYPIISRKYIELSLGYQIFK